MIYGLGVNYPINFSVDSKREFGFELGYQYGRIFQNKLTFSTGLQTNVYYIQSWKNATTLDIYLPLLIGYTWQKIEVYGGISSYITNVITFSKYAASDPEVNTDPYLFILPRPRVFGICLNASMNYNISQRWIVFTDFLTLNTSSFYIIKSNYGLLTFGVKYRLSKNTQK